MIANIYISENIVESILRIKKHCAKCTINILDILMDLSTTQKSCFK